MPVVTISRTLGSGGAAIGKELARRLKYRYFDKEELMRLAKDRNYLKAELEVLDEKGLPLFDTLFRDRPKEFLTFLHEAICDEAEKDNVVIIGRGSQAILRELSTAFHVRIDAPLPLRIKAVMERFGDTEAQARRRIKEVDQERGNFVKQAFGVDWSDPLEYHLVLNTGLVDHAIGVKIILNAFKQIPWAERRDKAKGLLQRYRLARAIRESLIRHPDITCPSSVNVRCEEGGVVILEGKLLEPRDRPLIENTVRRVKGVKTIVNRLKP